MQLTYSPDADALAVALATDARSVRSVSLAPAVTADFDDRGRLIAVEILNASDHYPPAALRALGSPVQLLTLSEAAADPECDLKPASLRHLVRAGRLAGVKKGNRWLVARHDLWTYLENRRPRVRRLGRTPGGP